MPPPNRFEFRGYTLDRAGGSVRFAYGFDDGPDFVETIAFGAPLPAADAPGETGLRAALDALHVMAGVSYYKAHVPPALDLGGLALAPEQIEFFRTAYADGLAEFAYRGGIDLSDKLRFVNAGPPPLRAGATDPLPPGAPGASAILVGGGKDSLVSVEALRRYPGMAALTVNPRAPMLDGAAAAGLPMIGVRRTLDPELLRASRAGEVLNGHVPITAIVSLIAVAGSFVHGYRNVVLSNERSADEPTLVSDGIGVNHQFSKSTGFEAALAEYVAKWISPDIGYFSFLRPLSELHIAQLFARTDRYDRVFTSCNRAFRLSGPAERLWCRDCAKCRFTFLMLATAMPQRRLVAIFGGDLLADAAQVAGYADLMGLGAHKPWDCVGEELEARAALAAAGANPEWAEAAVVRALLPAAREGPDLDAAFARFLRPLSGSAMPAAFREILDAYVG